MHNSQPSTGESAPGVIPGHDPVKSYLTDEAFILRFWSKVDVRGKDECWPWMASLMKRGGYGQIRYGRMTLKAHRTALELSVGALSPDVKACHRCDFAPCCNPSHLYPGSTKDNWGDYWGRGGHLPMARRGEKSPSAKLTAEQVAEIRSSGEDGVALGRRFGVSKVTISNIRRGKTWKT
jgi:hypothetical protein